MRHFVNSVIFEERPEFVPAFFILTMQNLKHMQNQLDLFEQPIQQNETLYFVTWEEKKLNRKTMTWLSTTKTKTTCRPMPRDEMYEFIDFLKSTFIYCGWYHITKAN